MFKLLKNPFYIYVLGFALTFIVYTFNWSDIYPDLTVGMKLFFTITFISFFFVGIIVGRLKLIGRTVSTTDHKLIKICFYIISILYAVEFLFERDIPLIATLLGRSGISYREFGIPILHGILISFNSFLIAHSFAVYMFNRNKKILIYNLLLYVPALLIINRSIIMFGVITSVFIYLHYIGKVKFKNKIKLILLALVGLFLFGFVGNLRSGEEFIYTQSKVKKEFMESSIPKEYYWTYLYVASPLANFQNTVNKKYVEEYDLKGFLFYENLPRIISKNLGEPLNIERKDLVRIVPWLTVGTTYARSYSYLSWAGPYLLFVANLLIYFLILFLVPKKSNYHITTVAILSVIVLLNIFTNILIVTGISFQLAYCVIFAFFQDKKIVYKEIETN
ncbi:O-antigen polymerase [Maribacter sp. ACAM166]|uniref:O-antigen polymerase n=1 Tax=Maribacter sp. ACAM166 TaxID=2508996 RepID=UPI0010FF1CFE|nr:O-antigen polymerase [Maribacter sp. ACAM166]TLP80756.1 oligosaccharide repeat unit polymerase [Maribacter sp. ACAM166]